MSAFVDSDSDHATCLLGQQWFGARCVGSDYGGLGCLVLKDEAGDSTAASEAGRKDFAENVKVVQYLGRVQ